MVKWAQFFHDQIKEFVHDHKIGPENVTQPRPWRNLEKVVLEKEEESIPELHYVYIPKDNHSLMYIKYIVYYSVVCLVKLSIIVQYW